MINRQLHSLLKIKSKFVDKNAIFSIFNVPILSLLIKSFLLILFLFSVSCNQFKVSKEEVIARVGSVYLYRTDLEKELDLFINKDDSILNTRNFIDQWARNQIILQGDVPSPIHPPKGCCFHPRCSHRMDKCSRVTPELKNIGKNHLAACFL